MRQLLLCASVALLGIATGCAKDVCDRSSAYDPASKKGDCDVSIRGRVLGDACTSGLGACSDADKDTLDALLECHQALPVCASGEVDAFVQAQDACFARASSLSESCRNAMFGDGLPGNDGGTDGGEDAGVQPDTENAGALDLFGTADETTIALAWSQSQKGEVARWEVYPTNEVDLPFDTLVVENQMFAQEEGEPMARRKYFVAGFNAAGELVSGDTTVEDAGMDAGMAMCATPFDCPSNRVCDLGACVEQTCGNSDDCPGGYLCHANSGLCERVIMQDAGTPDAGMDAGVEETSRPFISEQIEVTTGPAQYSPDRVVSDFSATSPGMVAFDTARAFVIMEQDGQIAGYYTENRGQTFRTVPVDSTGRFPRLAHEPVSETVFACYTVTAQPGSVRVRASHNQGRTWPLTSLELASTPDEEGNPGPSILDCAIAPWTEGTAIVAAVEGGNRVNVWTVSKSLEILSGPTLVFESGTYGEGAAQASLTSPGQIALTARPEDLQVHLLMTVTRTPNTGGGPRNKIIGFYRAPTTGGSFQGPGFVGTATATAPFNYTAPTVAIDPVSKRGVAAFQSDEGSGTFGGTTIYVATFNNGTGNWTSGTDLNVFYRPGSGGYIVFPNRQLSEAWSAMAPNLVVDKKGRMTLAMLAGRETGNVLNLNVWAVPFDMTKPSPGAGAGALGYFGTPCPPNQCDGTYGATRVSPTRAAKLDGRVTAGPIMAADAQISTWLTFIEGVGAAGDAPNRPVVITRPR